jgi:hypothetical protein
LYLPEYRGRRRILLAKKPSKLVHQYGESIFTTGETSFDAMNLQSSLTCKLLSLLAFLDPEDIVEGREEAAIVDKWASMISPDMPLNSYDIEAAFAILESFSLIRQRQGQCSYSMHKLVHAWGYDRLELAEQQFFAVVAAFFLETVIAYCAQILLIKRVWLDI